jgi:hypothetical protein
MADRISSFFATSNTRRESVNAIMPEAYRPSKLFTVEQANAVLPLVRAITADLVQLSREVMERRERLVLLSAGRNASAGDPYAEELAQIEEELEKDSEQLQTYVDELRELGVEPKSGPEGLVDFPAKMDGRIVLLCWKLGEAEVTHWHELNAGFAGRQSLVAGSVARDGDASHEDESL